MTIEHYTSAAGGPAAVDRARSAARDVEHWDQQRVDRVVATVGWLSYREDNVRAMSKFAYESTGLGDPEEMVALHRRRVLGTLRDLHGVKTVGLVDERPGLGIARYAKPIGVIVATSPATAPCQTAVCITLPMLKTRNAVILVPSPRGQAAVAMAVGIIRAALQEAGAPVDLVQCAEASTKEAAATLMRKADLVVATGGEQVLKRAHRSGSPVIGAGVGNATVIVDETADLRDAAEKVAAGACFNNGTSCSSESNVLVETSAMAGFVTELTQAGVHVCDSVEVDRLRALLWPDGVKIDRKMVGQPAAKLAADAGIHVRNGKVRVLAAPLGMVDLMDPLWGEKLSPVFALTKYQRFDDAVDNVQRILAAVGSGHSCGIHSRSDERVALFAERIHSARLLVNQSIAFGNSGSYDNGLPFSPAVACGSWGGCGQSENVTWRNYLNYTTVSRKINPILPDEELIFGALR